MIMIVILTCLISTCIYFIETTKRCKWDYVTLFLVTISFLMIFSHSGVFSAESDYKIMQEIRFDVSKDYNRLFLARLYTTNRMSQIDYDKLLQKAIWHEDAGRKCLEEAKRKCCLYPDRTMQQNAQQVFATAIATQAGGTPMSKVCVVALTLLLDYGWDVMDEWLQIRLLLDYAETYFESAEAYRYMINQACIR
jgi:hypothetical protein